jgi:hypothetical protein
VDSCGDRKYIIDPGTAAAKEVWMRAFNCLRVVAHKQSQPEPQQDAAATARASPRWVPDSEVVACMHCKKDFGLFRARHHCRHCGWVVCDGCSGRKLALERATMPGQPKANGVGPQRVCDSCFEHIPLDRQRQRKLKEAERQRKLKEAEQQRKLEEAERQRKLKEEEQQRQRKLKEEEQRKLKEAMAAHGLAEGEQAQLLAEGVTTVSVFDSLSDEQLLLSGIDIAARREAKKRRDQAAEDQRYAAAVAAAEQEHASAVARHEQEYAAAVAAAEQEHAAAVARHEQAYAAAVAMQEQEHAAAVAMQEQEHAAAVPRHAQALWQDAQKLLAGLSPEGRAKVQDIATAAELRQRADHRGPPAADRPRQDVGRD